MSLTNTLASLALGVATESGSNLLENTFDAATTDLAQEGREMAHDAGHSFSRHLAKNPRHALEQNPPHTRVVDTRFLAQSPLTTSAQDLALAGIGAAWQVGTGPSTWLGAGDLVQMDLGRDITYWLTKHAVQEVSDWVHTDSNLRFYGEPLFLLSLLGGSGLAGLGLGAVALKTLTRKPPKTNRDSAGTGTEAESGTEVGTGTEAASGRPIDELLGDVLAARGITISEEGTPVEERPTESGGMLDVDPPSRADPPTRVNATIDEVPVGGAPADLGAAPLAGEASGVAALPFGSRTPEDVVEEDPDTVFALPAPNDDGVGNSEENDIAIDLSSLSDSLAPDVSAVEENPDADIPGAEEVASSPDLAGLEVDPAGTGIQTGPITVIEAPYSVNEGVTVDERGEILLSPDPEIANAFFSDATEDLEAPPPPPHFVLIPAAAPDEMATEDTLDADDTDEVSKVARTSGEGTDPGSQQQREQLREEVLADNEARAPAAPVVPERSRSVPPVIVPPTEPAEPVVLRIPVSRAPSSPRIVQRRVTPLFDAPMPLPVAVGPSPDEPRPIVAAPTSLPPERAPEAAPAGNIVTLPAPKPTPRLWEQGITWLLDRWHAVWNSIVNSILFTALNGLASARVEEAELPAADPLVYKGPMVGSEAKALELRVPFRDQQIKDQDWVTSSRGYSALRVNLRSHPLQFFLEEIFPYGSLSRSPQIADEITARYHALLITPNAFTRVAYNKANSSSHSLDGMIVGGFLRNRDFAAIMMQLSLERVGVYSEIVTGVIKGERITAIAVYRNENYRGTPTALINVTNVCVGNPSHFKPDSTDWIPRPSKRGKNP